MLVHSDELEEEVCKASEIERLQFETVSPFFFLRHNEARNTYNNQDHSQQALFPSEVTSHDENHDCDRNCGNCESKFDIPCIHNNDDELDCESKEEEEVKLEECNVDLMARIST